ncbi:hypothetical protein THTE_0506 [Thermogutta terrifontis]|uniref:Uncharacterized protein n=1 Tax=Thermogutta terrifontis TaxID=1331910 RepID=A0A286RAX2_9BACT|nr:hypothetical protein THTE_0506 [Thermogutta terrifontis]
MFHQQWQRRIIPSRRLHENTFAVAPCSPGCTRCVVRSQSRCQGG